MQCFVSFPTCDLGKRNSSLLIRCIFLKWSSFCFFFTITFTHQGGYVFTRVHFDSWLVFVSRITQKPLNWFPWNLAGGLVSVQYQPMLCVMLVNMKWKNNNNNKTICIAVDKKNRNQMIVSTLWGPPFTGGSPQNRESICVVAEIVESTRQTKCAVKMCPASTFE